MIFFDTLSVFFKRNLSYKNAEPLKANLHENATCKRIGARQNISAVF